MTNLPVSEKVRELLAALPDEIDLFRIIRDAGRKDIDKARAVEAIMQDIATSIRAILNGEAG
jgi:predicted thioredoxin/glutaredoxin